jgi:hypothetical protein
LRFLAGLSADDQQSVQRARAKHLEGLKRRNPLDRTAAMRQLALDMRAKGAELRSSIASSAYKWLKANDQQWFDEHFPVKESEAEDVRRSRMRAIATAAKAAGTTNRTALYKRSADAYKWLVNNDAAWFDDAFPRAGAKRQEESRERHRAIATAAVERGIVRRIDLKHESQSSYTWLYLNDSEWLDALLPSTPRNLRWRSQAKRSS